MGLIKDVEIMVRASGLPYIAVDEAKKALFAGRKLQSFHYVIYFQTGANWLVWCGERTTAARQCMAEWQAIFGDGFRSVYAVRRADGIRFLDIDGNRLGLTNALNADVPATRCVIEKAPEAVATPAEEDATLPAFSLSADRHSSLCTTQGRLF